MTQRLMKSIFSFAGAIALFAVAGCTPTESYWSDAQAKKENKVEPIRLVYDVKFPSGNQLPANEIAQLDAFLDRHDVGYGDRVYVLTGAAGTATTRPRTDAVIRQLARQGVQAATLPSPEAQPGLVRIVVNRYVVVPQHCPDWSKPGTSDYSNTAMSNLGCSNTSNLGLMVADPSELIQGRPSGDADATSGALAVQRYRTDKVKALEKSGTDTKNE